MNKKNAIKNRNKKIKCFTCGKTLNYKKFYIHICKPKNKKQ